MNIAQKILIIYVVILLFLLGGCTAQDKSNNPSAKKSTIIYNDISNFESFEKYFVLKEREISETEINNVIKAISAINPNLLSTSSSVPENSNGNFVFNNPTLNKSLTIKQIKLQGAHMQKGILSFDRIDLSDIKFESRSNEAISVENITIISPKLETANLILLSLQDSQKTKENEFKLNDLLKQGGQALAIKDFSISNEHGTYKIGSIIWGRDQKKETSDFQVVNIEFLGKDNIGNGIEASLSSFSIMGISGNPLQNFLIPPNLENIYNSFLETTFKLYNSIEIKDLNLKSEYANLKIEAFTNKLTKQSGVTKNRYSSSPITIELKNSPPSKEVTRVFEIMEKIGYKKITFQHSQESELDINNNTLKINNGLISVNSGFDLSYNYDISNLNKPIDIKNYKANINQLRLDEFQLRFDDKSILERVIKFYATEVRKTTQDQVKSELATVLTLAPLMTKGLFSELSGELSSELIKLINDGGSLSIIIKPEKPISISTIIKSENAGLSKKEIGFSAKAEK